ncbi:MAG: PilN domain-containing protein [Acetobacteraceae bacterium]|nr:PilN domain-containing protein [Acetobacteraceae bacterium]
MATVNLMPEELKLRKGRRRSRALVALGGVLAALLLAWASWAAWARLEALDSRLRQATAEYESYRPVLAKRAQLSSLSKELGDKRAFIAQAKGTAAVSGLLELVDTAVPGQVLLTELEVKREALVLKGSAPDLVEVARFMSGLWESGRFKTVEVAFPQPFSGPWSAHRPVAFVITAILAPAGST